MVSTGPTLGARYLVRAGARRSLTQRQCRRLEGRLGLVVVVHAMKHIDVQRDARFHRKARKHMGNHFAAQCANLFAHEAKLDVAEGPRGKVHDRTRKRLVQRRMAGAVALHALDRAERLLEREAERNRTVLGGVVVVNPRIPFARKLERHAAVLGEGMEHLSVRHRRSSGTRTWSRNPMPVCT